VGSVPLAVSTGLSVEGRCYSQLKYVNLAGKPMQQLLPGNSGKTMQEQRSLLIATLENWRGDLEQVDDVRVIGIVPFVQNTDRA